MVEAKVTMGASLMNSIFSLGKYLVLIVLKIFVALTLLGVVAALFLGLEDESSKSGTGKPSKVSALANQNRKNPTNRRLKKPMPVRNHVSNWRCNSSLDELRGTKTKYAINESWNKHDFRFPYSGGTKLSISLRSGGISNAIMFRLNGKNKGQMLCTTGCKAHVKFDDQKPITYNLTRPADYSHDTAFIKSKTGFLKRLKASKQVIIEMSFYKEGRRQFKFNTKDLDFSF